LKDAKISKLRGEYSTGNVRVLSCRKRAVHWIWLYKPLMKLNLVV